MAEHNKVVREGRHLSSREWAAVASLCHPRDPWHQGPGCTLQTSPAGKTQIRTDPHFWNNKYISIPLVSNFNDDWLKQ